MALIKLDSVTFEDVIYDEGRNCLVVFTRKSCHICKEVIPKIEELFSKYKDRYGFYLVDVEDEKDLYSRFPLKGVPTIMFFKDGEYKGKIAGMAEKKKIEEIIDKTL